MTLSAFPTARPHSGSLLYFALLCFKFCVKSHLERISRQPVSRDEKSQTRASTKKKKKVTIFMWKLSWKSFLLTRQADLTTQYWRIWDEGEKVMPRMKKNVKVRGRALVRWMRIPRTQNSVYNAKKFGALFFIFLSFFFFFLCFIKCHAFLGTETQSETWIIGNVGWRIPSPCL